MKTETYTLPAYWASALINGDWSGYDELVCNDISEWCHKEKQQTGIDPFLWMMVLSIGSNPIRVSPLKINCNNQD